LCWQFYDEAFNKLEFAQTEASDSLDIVINEILFNPRSGGVDFVEIYNNSPKFIDLKNATVSNFVEGSTENIKTITTENFIFKPATYLVLTTDPQLLKSYYPSGSENVFFKTDLPTLPDDEGTVAINVGGKVIDFFAYSSDYHSPLLKDDEGVSLERIFFSGVTNDPNNWKSCNASSGYATPGLLNSNSKPASFTEENAVVIEPEVFSPQQDFTKINYKFDQSNYSANVKILDAEGRLIKEIANNQTLSFEGFFRWDGDRDDGTKARMGYYTVWVEVFDLTGMVKTFRKRVVVSSN
jgi:Flagellar hook capping protein